MSMALVSLLFLVGAIALGFFRKVNVGLISVAGALILGQMLGMKDADIIKGFNASLFITLMGVTFLFSILNTNGTIEIMAKKIVMLAGKQNWLIPIAIYAVGLVLTTIGPGAIPMLAIMPAFAIPVAIARGYNPIMLALIADFGVFSGRMSGITPEGILVRDLLAKDGIIAGLNMPLYVNQVLTGIVCAVIAFIYYKGYKVDSAAAEESNNLSFSPKQLISLIGLLVMTVLVIGFKFNVGLVSFAVGAVLLCLNVADESKSIKGIPWGVLIMVSGVGTLMELAIKTGGITLLSNTLAAMMNSHTASAIMGVTAGVMSWFSSGLGVVFPTLIPTVGSVAKMLGANVDPRELASLVVIGGTFTGVSPLSTTGALIIATVMTEEGGNGKEKGDKLFIELFVWSVVTLVVLAILALLGVYKLFL